MVLLHTAQMCARRFQIKRPLTSRERRLIWSKPHVLGLQAYCLTVGFIPNSKIPMELKLSMVDIGSLRKNNCEDVSCPINYKNTSVIGR